MGTDITKGTTYTEGQQVSAANLNAHVDDATIKYTAISSRTLKDPASMGDELLINDGGVLKKITLQQIHALTNAPTGCVMDYAGTLEPSGWLFCFGQEVSRLTYANLFAIIGEVYGEGNGSTTFALPDCRGRVTAGKDDMGGSSANRITTAACGVDGDTLGASGGSEFMQAHTHNHWMWQNAAGGANQWDPGPFFPFNQVYNTTSTGDGNSENVQPTIIFNKIIKI